MSTIPKSISWAWSVLPILALTNLPQSAIAQSITPAPDGVGTVINHNGNIYYIGGGTQAGANLFHSFQEFGLSPNEIANFLSNPQIQNVVGRVIGGNPSVIQGLIQLTGGNSNLYLMNPAGWVFTNGASLDVPGSFGVTTANRIGFGSGFFNAVGTNNFETLLGSPSSLIFDTTQPGAILNAADLSVANGSLWMVGGSVINTGTLSTPNGTVTLAAVPGTSQVKLTADGMTLGLLLDALPAGEITPNTPLGLKPEDLPRYLAGGSHIGNATGVEIGADGGLYLVGSAMRLEQGQVVIAGEINGDAVQLMASGTVTPTEPGLVQGDVVTVVRYPEAGGLNTLSVIDSRADDPETLLYGGAAGTIARVIQRDENGMAVITETLADIAAEGGTVDAVSITAEGNQGNFWLGNAWVTDESVDDYRDQLLAWRNGLSEEADLLLYSCFTALGATGDALIASLVSGTRLDVAASVNATGSANLGGDWVLESSTGTIEALTPFSDLTLNVWEGRLANQTVTNLNNSGTGSLRSILTTVGLLGNNESVTFGVTGTVNLLSTISWSQAGVTIDGNGSTVKGNNSFGVFNSTATSGTTTIQNLTISGGSASVRGGGIYSKGALTLTNSTISDNSAGNSGGGIFSWRAVTLTDSSISDNSAIWGGGIYSQGAVTLTNSTVSGNSASGGGGIDSRGAVTLTNSTVSDNSATWRGGGIYSGWGAVTLTNSTVSGNSATNGGGIFGWGAVTLTNSTVSDNSATNSGGGISGWGAVTLTNSTVSDNSATNGGGIFGWGAVTLNNSTVSDNSANDDGGGIYSRGALTLTNSTVSGNSADTWGGGIYSRGALTLTNSTVSDNSATTGGGGGIFGSGAVTLTNSTVSDNSATNGSGIYSRGAVTLTNSTVSDNSSTWIGGGILGRAVTLNNSSVSGNSANSGGGIFGSGAVTLTNSTVSDNSANSGGGIYSQGAVTLTNSTVSDNSATSGGGGIRSSGAVTLTNSTVSDNSATTWDGGGILSWGAVTLTNSTVSDNSATWGGGIYSRGAVTLTNSTVSGNSSTWSGGGILGDGAVTLTNSTVSDNSATNSGGGISGRGAVTLTNSTVSDNSATNSGGGIFGSGAVTLTNSTVSDNSATWGGGIRSDGAVTLTNSTVSGNSSRSSGGGIYSRGAVTLTNSTLAFNTASSGGGMHVRGTNTHTINNTIIANNRAGTGPDIGIYSGTHTFNINNSLILSTAGMSGTGIPTNGVNGNIVGADPQLAPLANNGGPTQTHALLPTSPAINAGGTISLTTDQRGFARVVGGRVDMGAFEFAPIPPTVTPPTVTPPAFIPAFISAAAPGLDLATIRRIWSDPIEETDELIESSILERACASIPNLELEQDDGETVTEDEPLEAAAQTERDENCLPLRE